MECIQPKTIDHNTGTETGFVSCFNIGSAVREEVCISPKISGIAGKVPGNGKLRLRDQLCGDNVAGSIKETGSISQPVLSGRNAPGHPFFREKNFSGGQGLIHLHAKMRSPGDPDDIPGLIYPVHGKLRFLRML